MVQGSAMAGNSKAAKVTLKSEQRKGIKRPVIHVLMPDNRVTEFKGRGIVIPDGDTIPDEAGGVFAVLVTAVKTSEGITLEPFFTPDGELAVVDIPVHVLEPVANPDAPLSWEDVARQLGVSLSTAKRMVGEGIITPPAKVPGMKRKVQFTQGDVDRFRERIKAASPAKR